ncbi:slit homolog 3 protein-like [Pseudomyrmex gracilis]|uniref:slit homolog 3 protein-like n=1 Tax=Pseudomyrmex gracilis TaxID=219809 RepID=UPI000994951C|nr:slit homolog 3 protein-like [Pseudomyrmex gracilis]XP_020277520.1 slit homolog 3 protein-like [Pseudomyrmex gracilis]XP_020277521.1 slit homolog 3 protein-like [Pseudomyrmex gracilis]XP_020277522.1 slit homolog 3 protein-like [Pseudomyrmex gracilis]
MVNSILLLWALVGLIGRVHGKCSSALIAENERSIAYACVHGDLSDLDELPDETEWIEFSVSRFYAIPDDAFRRFPHLRRLSFYNCHVNVIEPAAFRGLQQLDWLIFHGVRIYAAKAAWFRHLPNLRKLVLDRCDLVYIEPDVFRTLPRLETLDLRDNDLDCLSVEELSHLKSLRTVRIDGNPWLCHCRFRMDKFFLERSIVQEIQCRIRPGVCTKYRNPQCMTHVDIPLPPPTITIEQEHVGSRFQTSALTSLDRLPDRTTWIEISGLRIDRLPAYVFFRFGNSLRNLEMRDCLIGSIEPGAFAGLNQLQRLTLAGNRLPVVTAHWFSDLTTLQQLILARNNIKRIEPGALRPLADTLRHLDVRYNQLRCLSTNELAYLRHLERLDAVGNPWNCECRRNLLKYLTDRNIGYEISDGRCYEEDEIVDEQHTDIVVSTYGQIRWTTFEQVLEKNITVSRPPTEIEIKTDRPPIHRTGTCAQDEREQSRQVFVCSIASLRELDAIPRSAHTIRITFSDLKTIPTRAFARFDGWLSRLELRDCGIETIEYRAFVDLFNLDYLSLRGNHLELITSEMLEGLTKLRHLDLSRNNIHRINNDVFATLPMLHSLDISENYMNCFGVEYMARKMPYLSSLKAYGNPWSCLCGSKLADFLDSRRIPYSRDSLLQMSEYCFINATTTTPRSTAIIPKTTTTTEPPSTGVYEKRVQGSCTRHEETTGPRYRCVGGNLALLKNISSDAVSIEFYEGNLSHLPPNSLYKFQNLKELIIRNCDLQTIQVDAFRGLDSLERLTIQDNPLKSIEADWFTMQHLERLDLRGNSIRYIVPGAFRHLHKLVYLNLEGNDLQCIFTSDLQNIPDLHIVEFAGNPLKWRCRMDLEQFLETRKIKFVKVENSCEGKKIMRNLLYQNRTAEPLECPPGCSTASDITQETSLIFITFALFFAIY